MQAALDYANNLDDVKPVDEFSRNLCISLGQAFIKGAKWADEHQAEKDNELTWEDMHIITIIEDKLIHELCLNDQTLPQTKEFFQKVLKRFKEGKEKTNGE